MGAQRLVSVGLVAFVVSSCVYPLDWQGSVTFGWSIGGASDPTACTDRSASAVHVIVRDDKNGVAADTSTPCAAFRARYLLDRGWYDASLTLVDERRNPVSETRRTIPFYVAPRADTFIEVAFDPPPPPL